MSYLAIKLENDDIAFNQDGQLQTINGVEGLGQNYKVWLMTQFGSDFRDAFYGFRLQELLQSTYDNVKTVIQLFVTEALLQHPRTKSIVELIVTKIGDRSYNVDTKVEIKDTEELIEIGGIHVNV